MFTNIRKIPIFIGCLLLSAAVFSQEQRLSLKIAPLALADDVSFPTIQAGLEWKLSKRLSLYNEFGIKYRKSFAENADTSFIPSRGFKIKTEVRYYFKRHDPSGLQGFYLAANGYFTRDSYNSQLFYYKKTDTAVNGFDAFSVKKNVFGLNFVMGFQKNITRKFAVDFYCGFGIRFRDVQTANKELDTHTDQISTPIDFNIRSIRDQVDANGGFSVTGNLTLGIRICYTF